MLHFFSKKGRRPWALVGEPGNGILEKNWGVPEKCYVTPYGEFLQNSPKCQARANPTAPAALPKFIMGMCLHMRRVLIGELTGRDSEDAVFSCSLVSSLAAPNQTPRHHMSFL